MRILVAVAACEWRRKFCDSQRSTWVQDANIEGLDVRFFFGRGHCAGKDEIVLDCSDDYKGLPAKTQGMCQYAKRERYDFLFKTDDDVYIRPERLAAAVPQDDYVGLFREGINYAVPGHCSGFGYWLSYKAISLIADAPAPDLIAEDMWVSRVLAAHGIYGKHDPRYTLVLWKDRFLSEAGRIPLAGNDIIASAEFAGIMCEPHKLWQDSVTEIEEVFNTVRL